ncbi:MAG: radical SAM protein [Nitrospira sp.]|nr:radical SAM protein [Nitrospira sp.]
MPSKVDVLFVTPPSRAQVYQELSQSLAAIEPPVWSGLIATYIQAQGFSVEILDSEALGLTVEETAKQIVERHASLTVFMIYGQQPSASTQCMPAGRQVCSLLNEAGTFPTLVIGTHPSALPEQTLREEPYRFVCEGEGPRTVLGLLHALRSRSLTLHNVPGLWYWDNGKIQHNPSAEKIDNLDLELPRQAWELLPMSRYRAHNWHCFDDLESRMGYASIQTSLGCPYKCSFCCINAPFGTPGIRYWSSECVIRQIDELVQRYGITNIKIPDEMFVLNRRHVLSICDAIIERGYQLNIWAYARVDTVQDAVLEKLRAAGFTWLGLGIESGSQHVRDGVEKGRFGSSEILRTVNRIKAHGMYVAANYIFGLPDDTHASMEETLALALELNAEWANFYCAMAYPGSPLHRLARQQGWTLPEDHGGPGWVGYSQHGFDTLPLPTHTLTATQVLDFRDAAFTKYFSSPRYLNLIEKTFGDEVVRHIGDMNAHTIRRRHHEPVPV